MQLQACLVLQTDYTLLHKLVNCVAYALHWVCLTSFARFLLSGMSLVTGTIICFIQCSCKQGMAWYCTSILYILSFEKNDFSKCSLKLELAGACLHNAIATAICRWWLCVFADEPSQHCFSPGLLLITSTPRGIGRVALFWLWVIFFSLLKDTGAEDIKELFLCYALGIG